MRVLVCGGRDFGLTMTQYVFIDEWLSSRLCLDMSGLVVIEGGAKGVDTAARQWAQCNDVRYEEYPADWKTHGKRAGYLRNKQMLDEGKPDLVIAFPGGKGTAMMVKLAKDAGVPVELVEFNG